MMLKFDPLRFIADHAGMALADAISEAYRQGQQDAQPNQSVQNVDTISRQAAIEAIDAVFPVDPMKSEYAQGIACGAALAKTYVEQLPSAQPEIIMGKWVGCDDDWLKTMCKCSECGAMIDINEKYRNFYCYHCGARMDGELV